VDVLGDLAASDVVANEGGNIQMVRARGDSIGTLFGGNLVRSESNIGRVEIGGAGDVKIVAGSTFYNDNAFVQNVVIGGTFLPSVFPMNPNGIYTTGSIGIIEVGGNMATDRITVNTDGVGPVGVIDLIYVQGDWASPELLHGLGGDIKFVYVGGRHTASSADQWQVTCAPAQSPWS